MKTKLEPHPTIEVANRILEVFPDIPMSVLYNKEEDEYFFVNHDSEIYYSDPFLEVVMKIRTEYLWVNCILNYSFITSDVAEDFHPNETVIKTYNL